MSAADPASTEHLPAADLDRRFYAFAVDRLLAWSIFAAAAYLSWRLLLDDDRVALGVVAIVGTVVLVSLVYAVLLGVAGTSPGKALTGLRVVDATHGRPIGVARAALRVTLLGFFTLPTAGLGLATLAWTAVMDPGGRRRGGHDRMTDAVVVDVRPVPEEDVETDQRPRQIVNLTAMRLRPAPAPEPVEVVPAPITPAPMPAPTSEPTATPTTTPMPPVGAPTGPPPSSPPRTPPPSPPQAPRPSAGDPLGGRTVSRAARVAADAGAPAAAAATAGHAHRWRVAFDTGEEFVVEGLALVGRRPEARAGEPVRHVVPLRSSDMSVSKTHAQFQVVPDGALVVMDRGSTNGSVLVRQGVSRTLTAGRPATLLDGDTVRFGDRAMTVSRETP